ncbi:MAG TPA: hypothetical protein PLD12_08845 [Bacteroidales bacterium]|nr:hypothetical protein [Bacteroidales bacterium]HPO65423.1 hypothetical protein [Bacteroidales bacterium]
MNQKFCLNIATSVGGMASKGLRAISYQATRKVGAGYNPSHITVTLMAIPRVVLSYIILSLNCINYIYYQR